MRTLVVLFLASCFLLGCRSAQHSQNHNQVTLVVVLSFDQYRGDYPTRFASISGERGFKRMIQDGRWYSKCLLGYAATQTGPGHATMLTGCYPSNHGIVSNNFCLANEDRCFYCATDTAQQASAWLLQAPALGDLLKQSSPQSKVVGVALKDRAAVLMSGVNANAVVFNNEKTGGWETSTNYPTPPWLASVSQNSSLLRFAGATWTAQLPETEAPLDNAPWEGTFSDGSRTFPHRISTNDSLTVSDVLHTPFSLDALFDMVMHARRYEGLGEDNTPDLLLIGASTTDVVGHTFGPDSREVQELYIHADRFVEKLIDSLDTSIGRNRYMLIVTSDHGVTPIPEYTQQRVSPGQPALDAGRLHSKNIRADVERELSNQYGKPPVSWISHIYAPHIYLRNEAIQWSGKPVDSIAAFAASIIRTTPGIGFAYSSASIRAGVRPDGANDALYTLLKHDVNTATAGHILMYPKPFWIFGSKPTTHGSPWEYDRWVPLMILGGGYSGGQDTTLVEPVDIVPTIAKLLGVPLRYTDGKPLRTSE